MAEKWQQWYPHRIDNWQGSANVQALSDLAYRAVHNLLQDMWKQADCALPNDDKELAKRSRVAPRWSECRDEVMDYFTIIEGRVTHPLMKKEWLEAQVVYNDRRERAKHAAHKRAKKDIKAEINSDINSNIDSDINPNVVSRTPQNADTVTSTSTETSTEEKQIPSRGKREEKVPDSRHVPFKLACQTYALHKQVPFVWDASEAKSLDLLLKAAPDLTLSVFQGCLNNRARSPGTPHGERPRVYLPHILRYQHGPLNEFNRTEESSGANRSTTGAVGRQQISRDAIAEAGRRRLGLDLAEADVPGAMHETQSGITPRDAGYVPPSMGGVGTGVRTGELHPRTLEGTA